jgi:predicted alpha/beta superfamily hydrolase
MIRSTASANVYVLNQHFHIPQLNRYRRICIYLPPDYHHTHKYYPVLYMQDGQNLFDASTAFAGEWKIDKTLNLLHTKKKDYGTIVVGIDNGGVHRANEYSAWARPRLGGGEADLFAKFLVHNLKPYIDTHFRTMQNAENTAISGSSMGGLFALYAALRYSTVFGKAGVLSPSLWFAPQIYDFAEKNMNPNSRIYVAGSRTESRFMQQNLQDLYWAFHRGGLSDYHFNIVLRDRGKHNERFWGLEFKKMYSFLQKKN